MNFILKRTLQGIFINRLGVIFICCIHTTLFSQDTINTKHNQMFEMSASTFRSPYSRDTLGNIIPHYVHKVKIAYGFMLKDFLYLKGGITYYNSSQIFTKHKNSIGFDFQTVLFRKKWHGDFGLHISNYTESVPLVFSNPIFAQYLSLGIGFTMPIKKKWAIDIMFRNSFNITLHENSFQNLPEGFIGIQYFFNGNNNYLRKNKKSS